MIKNDITQYTCDRCGRTQIVDQGSNSELTWAKCTYYGATQAENKFDLCAVCYNEYTEYMKALDKQWQDFIDKGKQKQTTQA